MWGQSDVALARGEATHGSGTDLNAESFALWSGGNLHRYGDFIGRGDAIGLGDI